jgi:cysteine-rich repeat protein
VREQGEACDDGNTLSGDGCAADCRLESGFVCGNGNGATCNRSCAGMTGTECQGGDCCASLVVQGGTIQHDGRSVTVPDFRLDRYEVTVARFRAFQNAADAWLAAGNPMDGAGAHPDVPDSGWRSAWLADAATAGFSMGLVPSLAVAQHHAYAGDPVYTIDGADALAINWVPWHIAFAFCIWDGGRLPADAEWIYAGYRGEEQSVYAWGDTPSADDMFAVRPPGILASNPYDDMDQFWDLVSIPVGSSPASVGRYGQEDMMVGLWEFVRDTQDYVQSGDFIRLLDDADVTTIRGIRGGSWEEPATGIPDHTLPLYLSSNWGDGTTGFRCARTPSASRR